MPFDFNLSPDQIDAAAKLAKLLANADPERVRVAQRLVKRHLANCPKSVVELQHTPSLEEKHHGQGPDSSSNTDRGIFKAASRENIA